MPRLFDHLLRLDLARLYPGLQLIELPQTRVLSPVTLIDLDGAPIEVVRALLSAALGPLELFAQAMMAHIRRR